jgi:3-oxoacyl-[acyl-carrier protein] reductase
MTTSAMFDKPIAIVTGASRGIGRAIAVRLAGEGFDVVVNYVSNAAAAKEVGEEIAALGARAHLVRADISVAADRGNLVQETLKTFGRIDLLVNNAGVAPEARADLLEATEESFDRLININLKGPYFLTQLVAREMIRIKLGFALVGQFHGPKIVNITSVSAYAASVNRGDYCVAKAGLAMMTQLFAARLAGEGIHVYEIRPGIIATDMTEAVKGKYDELIFEKDLTPIRRWGSPEDVAAAVAAVAKDLLPFSTGEVINVDGGFHMRRL